MKQPGYKLKDMIDFIYHARNKDFSISQSSNGALSVYWAKYPISKHITFETSGRVYGTVIFSSGHHKEWLDADNPNKWYDYLGIERE